MFHKNANITFELTIPGAAEQKTVDYNVTVENMDKDAPKDAKVYWRLLENGEVQGRKYTWIFQILKIRVHRRY